MDRANWSHGKPYCIVAFIGVFFGAVLARGQTDTIAGVPLTDEEEKSIQKLIGLVARELPDDRATKIEKLAYSAWWGLREGLFRLKNPELFNHCTVRTDSGCCMDRQLQTLEACPHLPQDLSPATCPAQHPKAERACKSILKGQMIWQVGMVGALVDNFHDDQVLKAIAKLRYANTAAAVLEEVVGPKYLNIRDQKTHDAILSSQGELRRSYLLRHSAVAASLESSIIARCFPKKAGVEVPSWCITPNDRFASDRAKAEQTLGDLKKLIGSLVQE